jgi:flagellar motor protein MotB
MFACCRAGIDDGQYKVGIGTQRAYFRKQPVCIIKSSKRKSQLVTYGEGKMSESTSGVFKPLTWLLLLALFAVIALYGWHTSKLKQQIADRDETNLQLSQQRAETVLQELADRGVSASRMEAVGVGPIHPIADNNKPYGRALNRRVEIYVTEP